MHLKSLDPTPTVDQEHRSMCCGQGTASSISSCRRTQKAPVRFFCIDLVLHLALAEHHQGVKQLRFWFQLGFHESTSGGHPLPSPWLPFASSRELSFGNFFWKLSDTHQKRFICVAFLGNHCSCKCQLNLKLQNPGQGSHMSRRLLDIPSSRRTKGR